MRRKVVIIMADVLIYWDEIEDGAFPDCCMTCGCEDTELVPRTLTTYHYMVLWSYRRYVTVDLPFCPAHRSRPWIRWGRTDARSFTDEGVWMKNVAPEFVDEMEAFREEEEGHESRRRRKKHSRRRKRSRDRDDYDDRDDDRDNDREREPFGAGGQPMPRPSGGGGGSAALYIVLVVVLLPVLAVLTCCLGNIFLNGGNFQVQQPGPVRPGGGFNRPP
jgi:hypothetical protein